MPHRFINGGPGLPPAPSPISQAVVAGTHCYVSGQLAVDSTGVFRPGKRIDLAFLDLADVPVVNELFAELFPEDRRPARTIYQAAGAALRRARESAGGGSSRSLIRPD